MWAFNIGVTCTAVVIALTVGILAEWWLKWVA